MRLIDADTIKLPKGFFEKVDNVPKFYEWLNTIPTIDPVKYGYWIYNTNYESSCEEWTCSLCGADSFAETYFCHHCGARMDKYEENSMEEFMYGQNLGSPEDGSL